jgi:hypothetical protein
VPAISANTAAIISTALQLAPADRFTSILEMRDSIRTVLRGDETVQFAILGATSPIPTVASTPLTLPSDPIAPMSAPLFLPTDADYLDSAPAPVVASPATLLTDDISAAYVTTVITDSADNPVETHELDLAFAQHIEAAAADIDRSSERSLTMEHAAIVIAPQTRWRVFAFVVAVILCVAMLVLSNGGTNWQPWQADAQTISVLLVVDVPSDATLDASFQNALSAHLADSYGTEWTQLGTPSFLGAPPEHVATNTDGSSRYRGRITVTLTRSP